MNNWMSGWYSSTLDSKSSSRGYTSNYTHNPMPIWVDGCCVMKSPVAGSDRSSDTITIKVLSRELGNTKWTVYTSLLTAPYMEDLYGRLQPVQPQDVAIHWYTDTLYTDTLIHYTLIHWYMIHYTLILMIHWHKLVLKTEQIMTMMT